MNSSSRQRPATLLTLLRSLTPKEENETSIWTTKHLNSKGTPDRRFKENRALTQSDIDALVEPKESSDPVAILAKHGREAEEEQIRRRPSGVRRKVDLVEILKASRLKEAQGQ